MLPEEAVEAGRQSWPEQRNPEKAREVAENMRILERLDNAIEMLSAAVEKRGIAAF